MNVELAGLATLHQKLRLFIALSGECGSGSARSGKMLRERRLHGLERGITISFSRYLIHLPGSAPNTGKANLETGWLEIGPIESYPASIPAHAWLLKYVSAYYSMTSRHRIRSRAAIAFFSWKRTPANPLYL